ncbi:MAG: diguanylate cyclase [Oscillatoriales cyanobacterium SM2_2_1]|nr:diguanylate cyclase [Oscillatoriales cyanobacterium SM2_2_1]
MICPPDEAPAREQILVADPNPHSLRLLSNLLLRRGYRVICVRDGMEAWQEALDVLPDLIVVDTRMPTIDGFVLCDHLKSEPVTQSIPIIFMGGRDDVLTQVRAFESGGVDYLSRPFQMAEVMARIENQLSLRRLQKQLESQNELLRQEIQQRREVEQALQGANDEFQRLAHQDGLTEVANRRRFDQQLHQEWLRLTREQSPLSLLMCDIDFFKNYNDTYGHLEGDHCLQRVAGALREAVRRPADLVARYGGEEFAILMPNTDTSGAAVIAEQMRQQVAQLQILHEDSAIAHHVTISIGVATLQPVPNSEPAILITSADYALYRAKELGRNRVYILGDAGRSVSQC